MSEADADSTDPQSTEEGPRPLVRHTRRQDWGRALMLWEHEDKRGYQFEDGELRVFAKEYYKLLEPAQKPDPVLRYKLREQAAANGFVSEAAKKAGGGRPIVQLPSLDDQITVFRQLYPDGFQSGSWIEATRARGQGRRLKCHRDAALDDAAERLSSESLQACLDEGDYAEVLKRAVDVIDNTDLATRAQLDAFVGVEVDQELAASMVGFLHDQRDGELTTMARLRRALARQGVKKLAWPALTAGRALLHPNDHMCVSPSVVRTQAKLLVTNYKPSPTPNDAEYSRCLELAMAVREHLTKSGFSPRDLFDVTTFMKVTLSTKAKEQLTEAMVLRQTAAAAAAPAPDSLAAVVASQ